MKQPSSFIFVIFRFSDNVIERLMNAFCIGLIKLIGIAIKVDVS